MYIGLQKFKDVIDYIEDNINSDPDCRLLSSKMGLSVYEFRRIFSFIIGCPISEYIRKRRLSLAALELIGDTHTDILALSEKYGYSSQSAFTKAFSEFHGMAPTQLLKDKGRIKLFPVPKFEINISSGEAVDFSLKRSGRFYVRGFSEISAITDSCCCENVWNSFYESGADKRLQTDRLFVSYKNNGENVLCTIGERAEEADGSLPFEEIPESLWACFRLNTTDDDRVNEIYSKILYDWLPSARLEKRNTVPVVEVYPFDMSEDGFEWEICVPVTG